MLEEIINLPKHNILKISAEIEVISVENGWVYEFWDTNDEGYLSHVFVPAFGIVYPKKDTDNFDDFIEVKDGIENLLVPGGSVYKFLYIVDCKDEEGNEDALNRANYVFVPHGDI